MTALLKTLFGIAILTSAVSAAPHRQVKVGKAVYFLTNDAENAVVALPIGKDGMVSAGTVTKTGGKGSNAINGMTMQAAMPDPLVAQSSLTVVGNVSFNHNPFLVISAANSRTEHLCCQCWL
jgi:hypothetical protein